MASSPPIDSFSSEWFQNHSPTPTFTVVIPAYNQAHFIEQALDSVCQQTLPHWECLVLDDGSTDDTAQKVLQFKDPRIQLLSYPHRQGTSVRLNQSLTMGRSPFHVRLDGDDCMAPQRLETQWALFKLIEHQTPMGLIGCRHCLIDEQNHLLAEHHVPFSHQAWMLWMLCQDPPFTGGTFFYRPEWIKAIGGFGALPFMLGEDQLVLEKLSRTQPLVSTEETLMAYRRHSANHSPYPSLAHPQAIHSPTPPFTPFQPNGRYLSWLCHQTISPSDAQSFIEALKHPPQSWPSTAVLFAHLTLLQHVINALSATTTNGHLPLDLENTIVGLVARWLKALPLPQRLWVMSTHRRLIPAFFWAYWWRGMSHPLSNQAVPSTPSAKPDPISWLDLILNQRHTGPLTTTLKD